MISKEEKLYYEKFIPSVIKQLSRLADAVEKQNDINEKMLVIEKKKFSLSSKINEINTIKQFDLKENGQQTKGF